MLNLMNMLFLAILVNMVTLVNLLFLVLHLDFGEPADSRESGDFGKSVEPVVSGESHDCVEYADSQEFIDCAGSVYSGTSFLFW